MHTFKYNESIEEMRKNEEFWTLCLQDLLILCFKYVIANKQNFEFPNVFIELIKAEAGLVIYIR